MVTLTAALPAVRAPQLRSLLARTREWTSAAERARVADLCDSPAHARLAEALRNRSAASLRKGDMFTLCRVWGFRSSVWARRKDRPYAVRRDAPTSPALGDPEQQRQQQQQQQQQQQLALRDSLASQAPATQLAAVHSRLAELRILAERSVAAFSSTERTTRQLRATSGAPLPPPAVAILAESVAFCTTHMSLAVDNLVRLVAALREQHDNLQVMLLRLSPGERVMPAWRALSSKEAPWEAVLRETGQLADFAITTGTQSRVACITGGGDEHSTQADACLVAAGHDTELAALLADSCCTSGHVEEGGALALELVRVWSQFSYATPSLTCVPLAPHPLTVNAHRKPAGAAQAGAIRNLSAGNCAGAGPGTWPPAGVV